MKDMMAHAALSDALLLGGVRMIPLTDRLDSGGRLIMPVRLHACPCPAPPQDTTHPDALQ